MVMVMKVNCDKECDDDEGDDDDNVDNGGDNGSFPGGSHITGFLLPGAQGR